jgi:hypothetical protein
LLNCLVVFRQLVIRLFPIRFPVLLLVSAFSSGYSLADSASGLLTLADAETLAISSDPLIAQIKAVEKSLLLDKQARIHTHWLTAMAQLEKWLDREIMLESLDSAFPESTRPKRKRNCYI